MEGRFEKGLKIKRKLEIRESKIGRLKERSRSRSVKREIKNKFKREFKRKYI